SNQSPIRPVDHYPIIGRSDAPQRVPAAAEVSDGGVQLEQPASVPAEVVAGVTPPRRRPQSERDACAVVQRRGER
ncbi:hypothetical protein, partial [Pseudonocardia sp. TRM90224]|uniref:hypothetical protein n=1 Tax=Pseudonocardia sp. TRM90224 TaxID=2812678 RepID=UPI001E541C4B